MSIMNSEPNLAVGAALSALAVAIFAILNAAGIIVTEEMQKAVLGLIAALMMFPIIATGIARFFVFAPDTVQDLENKAYADGVKDATDYAIAPLTGNTPGLALGPKIGTANLKGESHDGPTPYSAGD